MNLLQPERLDALARDHALGTMTGGARRRFDRLVREQPLAARALARWQTALAPLAAELPEMQPREEVWRGLEQRLFKPKPREQAGAWRRWFSAPAWSGALAGLLVCTVLLKSNPEWIGAEEARDALPASYVGLLSDAAGKPAVLASSRRHGRLLTVKLLQPIAPPAGQQGFLWALPKDGSAPQPLGPVPAKGSGTIALAAPSEKLFFHVERLAVSFEAVGSQPAAPSAAFVLQGPCTKLW